MARYYKAFPEGEVRKVTGGQMLFLLFLSVIIVWGGVHLSKMPWEVKAASTPRKCYDVDLTLDNQKQGGFYSNTAIDTMHWHIGGVICEKGGE